MIKVSEFIIMGLIIAFSLLVIYETGSRGTVSSTDIAGPALLPRMAAMGVMILAGIYIFSMILEMKRSKITELKELISKKSWNWREIKKPLLTVIALAGYYYLFKRINFFLLTTCFLVFLFSSYELTNWKKIVVLSLLGSGLSYFIFRLILKIPID